MGSRSEAWSSVAPVELPGHSIGAILIQLGTLGRILSFPPLAARDIGGLHPRLYPDDVQVVVGIQELRDRRGFRASTAKGFSQKYCQMFPFESLPQTCVTPSVAVLLSVAMLMIVTPGGAPRVLQQVDEVPGYL